MDQYPANHDEIRDQLEAQLFIYLSDSVAQNTEPEATSATAAEPTISTFIDPEDEHIGYALALSPLEYDGQDEAIRAIYFKADRKSRQLIEEPVELAASTKNLPDKILQVGREVSDDDMLNVLHLLYMARERNTDPESHPLDSRMMLILSKEYMGSLALMQVARPNVQVAINPSTQEKLEELLRNPKHQFISSSGEMESRAGLKLNTDDEKLLIAIEREDEDYTVTLFRDAELEWPVSVEDEGSDFDVIEADRRDVKPSRKFGFGPNLEESIAVSRGVIEAATSNDIALLDRALREGEVVEPMDLLPLLSLVMEDDLARMRKGDKDLGF